MGRNPDENFGLGGRIFEEILRPPAIRSKVTPEQLPAFL
jgi:hypothetical protein